MRYAVPTSFIPSRIPVTEYMDQDELGEGERDEALAGLARLHRWPGQRKPALNRLARKLGPPGATVHHLVELGSSDGRWGIWVARQLERRGYRLRLTQTDRVPMAGIKKLDATGPLPPADLYFSNLLLHHLAEAELAESLRRQAQAATRGFFHYDLHRARLHFHAVRWLMRAGGLPPIVQADGPLSVQQSFTPAELDALGRRAGVAVRVRRHFPYRLSLESA